MLAALPKDQTPTPKSTSGIHSCNSCSRGSYALFWPPQVLHEHTDPHIDTQGHKNTNKSLKCLQLCLCLLFNNLKSIMKQGFILLPFAVSMVKQLSWTAEGCFPCLPLSLELVSTQFLCFVVLPALFRPSFSCLQSYIKVCGDFVLSNLVATTDPLCSLSRSELWHPFPELGSPWNSWLSSESSDIMEDWVALAISVHF